MKNTYFSSCLFFSLLLFHSCVHEASIPNRSDGKEIKPKPFLGIAFEPVTNLEKQPDTDVSNGIKILQVLHNTAAYHAGLKKDDIIFEYDSKNFADIDKKHMAKTFRDYIKNQKSINEEIVLKITRPETIITCKSTGGKKNNCSREELKALLESQTSGEKVDFSIEKKIVDKTVTIILGAKPSPDESQVPENAFIFPEFENMSSRYSRSIQQLLHEYRLEKSYADLLNRYSEDELTDHGFRLNLFRYIHRDPVKLPLVADITVASIEELAKQQHHSELIIQSASLLDVENIDTSICDTFLPSLPDTKNPQLYLRYVNQIMELSLKQRNLAFQQIDETEMDFLSHHLPDFIDHFIETSDISKSESELLVTKNMKTIRLSHEIDYSALMRSAWILTKLTDPEFLDSFFHALTYLKAVTASLRVVTCTVKILTIGVNKYTNTAG